MGNELIKRYRPRKRLTQMEAAKLLGVAQSTIVTWERIGLDLNGTDEAICNWAADKRSNPDSQSRKTIGDSNLNTAQRTAGFDYAQTRTEKLKREIERLEIKIKREKGELISAQEVRETGVRIASVWCAELDAMVSDLPGQLAGLAEADIQPRLKARIEALKLKIRKQMEAL
jgi:transcriptional regulator with XRE-family HTH domain